MLVSKRRMPTGPTAHPPTKVGAEALGPGPGRCAGAAYCGNAMRRGTLCRTMHLWCGQCTSRRAVSATGPDDACTGVNIMGAGATGHARKATLQRTVRSAALLMRCAALRY